jgi:hypothetical protein
LTKRREGRAGKGEGLRTLREQLRERAWALGRIFNLRWHGYGEVTERVVSESVDGWGTTPRDGLFHLGTNAAPPLYRTIQRFRARANAGGEAKSRA